MSDDTDPTDDAAETLEALGYAAAAVLAWEAKRLRGENTRHDDETAAVVIAKLTTAAPSFANHIARQVGAAKAAARGGQSKRMN